MPTALLLVMDRRCSCSKILGLHYYTHPVQIQQSGTVPSTYQLNMILSTSLIYVIPIPCVRYYIILHCHEDTIIPTNIVIMVIMILFPMMEEILIWCFFYTTTTTTTTTTICEQQCIISQSTDFFGIVGSFVCSKQYSLISGRSKISSSRQECIKLIAQRTVLWYQVYGRDVDEP